LLGTFSWAPSIQQINKKTKAYIATELKKFIDAVGPRFGTQICTDKAINMLGAIDDIVAMYPHIFK
jgi:hypothetical protein